MQKVEGSSPFSRLKKSPANAGLFVVQDPGSTGSSEAISGVTARNRGAETRACGPRPPLGITRPGGAGYAEQTWKVVVIDFFGVLP